MLRYDGVSNTMWCNWHYPTFFMSGICTTGTGEDGCHKCRVERWYFREPVNFARTKAYRTWVILRRSQSPWKYHRSMYDPVHYVVAQATPQEPR